MRATVENLEHGQLEMMWDFLRMGKQESNIPVLKKYLDKLRQALIQKTAGQRNNDPNSYVPFEDIGTICNIIVMESMCLYLSGDLDKLEQLLKGKTT